MTIAKRGDDIVAAEPSGILEFTRIDRQMIASRNGLASEHERGGKGPRLTGNIGNAVDADPGFFEQFASDRRFDCFADLDETGERRIAPRREMRLPAQQ